MWDTEREISHRVGLEGHPNPG
ncbi:MAG: hypothetical protein PWP58_1080, partial [Bacillota bacterium]|nr:hypothetical protein [Bacillota bacterium]